MDKQNSRGSRQKNDVRTQEIKMFFRSVTYSKDSKRGDVVDMKKFVSMLCLVTLILFIHLNYTNDFLPKEAADFRPLSRTWPSNTTFQDKEDLKTILLWNSFFRDKTFGLRNEPHNIIYSL